MQLTFAKRCHPLLFYGFLLFLSIVMSLPSIVRIPRMLPFLDPAVRAEVPGMLDQLRAEGLWLVNTDLVGIQGKERGICFIWDHRYTSRRGRWPPAPIFTCRMYDAQ